MLCNATKVGCFCVATMLFEIPAIGAVIDSDTVIGPAHPYGDETLTIVDGLNPPTKVTLLDGALVGDINGEPFIPIGLDVFGQSEVRILGGGIGGVQHAVLLHDQSVLHMLAGTLDLSGIEVRDRARAVLDDGEWRAVGVFDAGRVRVNGGENGSIFAVRTFGQSHAAINSEHLDFLADESSTMVLNGGNFEGAEVLGNANVLVTGGFFVTGLRARNDAIVRIRSIGDIEVGESIDVHDSAQVHIYGTGLRFEVIDDFGTLIPVIVGKLVDGDNFAAEYRLFDQGQIILHEVPEPASWALLAAAAVGVWLARRWR